MNVGDCMKRTVIFITTSTTIRQAALTILHHHIGTLPIVDEERKLVGIIQLHDLLNLIMPDFIRLVEDLDFVPDFGAVERHKPDPEILNQSVSIYMDPVCSVGISAGLLRAAAMIQEHQMRDLPVVDDAGHLVGIASYVDIGIALMANWDLST